MSQSKYPGGDDSPSDESEEEFLKRMAEKYEGEFKGRVAETLLQSSSGSEGVSN